MAINWQPKETAPRDGRQILARNSMGDYAVVYWNDAPWGYNAPGWTVMFSHGRPHSHWDDGYGCAMTHWAEITKPEDV